jgi:antitoxin MazE
MYALLGQEVKDMRARVVRIGNSKGIRLPKPLLDETGITEDVDLEVENNRIIIRPVSSPRSGWEDAFRMMAEKGDDRLVIEDENISHLWDEEEWQW